MTRTNNEALLKTSRLALLAGMLLLGGCGEVDETARLQQALDELVEAVEQRSVRQVNRYLAPDFKTSQQSGVGNIQGFMRLQFRSNRVIHIFVSEQQLSVDRQQGQISFHALVTGSGNWIPERGQRFYVKTRWQLNNGDWQLSRLGWEKQLSP
ncbi:MAG: hypothetical protein PVJ63_05560 [Thioalkalispiraceae bacterium]